MLKEHAQGIRKTASQPAGSHTHDAFMRKDNSHDAQAYNTKAATPAISLLDHSDSRLKDNGFLPTVGPWQRLTALLNTPILKPWIGVRHGSANSFKLGMSCSA